MTTRALLGALVLTIGLGTAVSASAPREATAEQVTRTEKYYSSGPSASADGDSGGVGIVAPAIVSVPDTGGRYDAVVIVSFQYVASGDGPWKSSVHASPVFGGNPVKVKPAKFALKGTATKQADSTSVRYLLRGLRAGVDYAVLPNVFTRAGGPQSRSQIETSKMLVTVELTRR